MIPGQMTSSLPDYLYLSLAIVVKITRFGSEAVLSLLYEGALPFQASLCRIMQNTHQEIDL